MKKILIVHRNMNIGGVEKSLLNFITELAKDSTLEIDLFLFCKTGQFLEELPKNINVVEGNFFMQLFGMSFTESKKKSKLTCFIRSFFALFSRLFTNHLIINFCLSTFKIKKVYDLAIAFSHNGSNKGLHYGAPAVVSKKVITKMKVAFIHDQLNDFASNSRASKKIYKDFDKVICVSKSCMDLYIEKNPMMKKKATYLYNVQDTFKIIEQSRTPIEFKNKDSMINFISVGRLSEEKNYIMLVEIFGMLKQRDYLFQWHLIGDGPEKEILVQKIAELGLERCVILHGANPNPYPYIKMSDALIISSKYEAASMIIGEAFILGVPVVSVNTLSAREQIGEYGIVVENNLNSLYLKLEEIIKMPDNLKKYKDKLENYIYPNKQIMEKFRHEILD